MNRIITNEAGEPMGTERYPDADEEYDNHMDNMEDGPDFDYCHICMGLCHADDMEEYHHDGEVDYICWKCAREES